MAVKRSKVQDETFKSIAAVSQWGPLLVRIGILFSVDEVGHCLRCQWWESSLRSQPVFSHCHCLQIFLDSLKIVI